MAECNNVSIKSIPYEYLKDYGFLTSNALATISDAIQQEVEYPACYCGKCDKTNLYEVKVIRGFADLDFIECPECRSLLHEMRLDGDYRVIKRFSGDNVSEYEINLVIVSHLVWTRISWDRMFSIDSILEDGFKILPADNCYICRKVFNNYSLGSMPHTYKRRKICIECLMSSRTLLIDCHLPSPSFEAFFGGLMQNSKKWNALKKRLYQLISQS